MTPEHIEHDFRDKVASAVTLTHEGVERFVVVTPFMFEDGDHLRIILRKEEGRWVLADEGHTYMHLTYELDEKDLQSGTRAAVISNCLSAHSVEDRDGELVLPVPPDEYGNALYTFVQALLRITDVTLLSRERIKSTFYEDFQSLTEAVVPDSRRADGWFDPVRDPEGMYAVDYRINGMARPVFLYALANDDQVRDATIAIHQFERWQLNFRAVGIFEEQESINRKVLARFTDVCDRQFSNLVGNRDRIARYLEEVLASQA